eukprot:14790877-Alexandrium_andersonii.AAC.1
MSAMLGAAAWSDSAVSPTRLKMESQLPARARPATIADRCTTLPEIAAHVGLRAPPANLPVRRSPGRARARNKQTPWANGVLNPARLRSACTAHCEPQHMIARNPQHLPLHVHERDSCLRTGLRTNVDITNATRAVLMPTATHTHGDLAQSHAPLPT